MNSGTSAPAVTTTEAWAPPGPTEMTERSASLWVPLPDHTASHGYFATLPAELEQLVGECTQSLRTTLRDIRKHGCKGGLIERVLKYMTMCDEDSQAAARELLSKLMSAFSEFRGAAAEGAHGYNWDYGKGPYFEMSGADEVQLSGRRVVLSSRCETVQLIIQLRNVRYPAVAGEPNVPWIQVQLLLSPFDHVAVEGDAGEHLTANWRRIRHRLPAIVNNRCRGLGLRMSFGNASVHEPVSID